MAETVPAAENTAALHKSKLLLGEGGDEILVFQELLKHLRIEDVQVEGYGGTGELFKHLKALRVRPGFDYLTALGIIRDADNDFGKALQSVCSSLKNSGFAVPQEMGEIVAGPPAVSVAIVPGLDKTGMLEDLCLASVREDVAWPCIEDYFACLNRVNKSLKNPAKARFSTWLIIQEDAKVRGLGGAAVKSFFNWEHPAFAEITAFLTRLFTAQIQDGANENS